MANIGKRGNLSACINHLRTYCQQLDMYQDPSPLLPQLRRSSGHLLGDGCQSCLLRLILRYLIRFTQVQAASPACKPTNKPASRLCSLTIRNIQYHLFVFFCFCFRFFFNTVPSKVRLDVQIKYYTVDEKKGTFEKGYPY